MVRTNETLLSLWLACCALIFTGCKYGNADIFGAYYLEGDENDYIKLEENMQFTHYGYIRYDGKWELYKAKESGEARLVFDVFEFNPVKSGIWSVELERCGLLFRKCFCKVDKFENKVCYVHE